MADRLRVAVLREGLAESERFQQFGLDIRRAMTRALNRTILAVQTRTLRAVSQDTGLTQAVIRKSLALQRATFSRQEATLVVTGKRIPIRDFGARETRAGVSYRLPGGRGTIPGAFIATMRSGHTGVFARRIPSRSRKGLPSGSPGLPIVEQLGPSLPHVVRNRGIFEEAAREAPAIFERNLDREIDYQAGKLRGGEGDAG